MLVPLYKAQTNPQLQRIINKLLNRILQVQILTFSRLKALTQEGECTRNPWVVVQPGHQNPLTHPPTTQLQLIW